MQAYMPKHGFSGLIPTWRNIGRHGEFEIWRPKAAKFYAEKMAREFLAGVLSRGWGKEMEILLNFVKKWRLRPFYKARI